MSDEPDLNGDDWRSWRKHVLLMQESHDTRLNEMNTRLMSIEIKLGIMQGKAAAYGTVAGLVASVFVGIMWKVLFK